MILNSRISFKLDLLAGWATLVVCTLCTFGPVAAQQPSENNTTKQTTEQTVQQQLERLDSRSFNEREAATQALINLGSEVLEPLAKYFFECSSEAGWRIHKILEGIGKNGNEEDFLKSVAMIQILYGAQDPQSQRRLAKLQYQWKATRRIEASRKLSEQGFEFVAEAAGPGNAAAMERLRIERMIRAAALRDIEGRIRIATGPDPSENQTEPAMPAATDWIDPREDQQASLQKIEKIIAGDDVENRAVVEGLLPDVYQASLPPGQLVVPQDWTASDASLKLIRELGTLSSLVIRNQKIEGPLKNFIAQQKQLNGLQLINCEFDADSEKFSMPPSIRTMRFEGTLPPIDSFSSLGQIDQLQLSKIELDKELATAISKCKVQIIDLEEVKFSRESIRRLVNMRGLFRVSLSLCKFELEWFDDVREKNQNLIVASPKAFLGVQGPIDIQSRDLTGCQISQVVPDTAASRAGMQALDVVTAMDGTKVERFEDLRLLISQKRPGDSMDLEVSRLEKKIKLKVTLGEARQISR